MNLILNTLALSLLAEEYIYALSTFLLLHITGYSAISSP